MINDIKRDYKKENVWLKTQKQFTLFSIIPILIFYLLFRVIPIYLNIMLLIVLILITVILVFMYNVKKEGYKITKTKIRDIIKFISIQDKKTLKKIIIKHKFDTKEKIERLYNEIDLESKKNKNSKFISAFKEIFLAAITAPIAVYIETGNAVNNDRIVKIISIVFGVFIIYQGLYAVINIVHIILKNYGIEEDMKEYLFEILVEL